MCRYQGSGIKTGAVQRLWDEPGGYPLTGQVVSGMKGDVSLVCCSGTEREKACPDTVLPAGGQARGSLPSRLNRRGSEYRCGVCRRTGS